MNPRLTLPCTIALLLTACTSATKPAPTLDQSTPTAGLLAFFDAISSGNPATARQCVYILPAHSQIADDMMDLYTAELVFHRSVNKAFPGQDKDIFWDNFTDATLKEARDHFADAKPTIRGNKAILAGAPTQPNETMRLAQVDWRMRNDQGRWKIDLEAEDEGGSPHRWDPYPPNGDQDISISMLFLLHESCPGLRQIAADADARKFKTIDELKAAADVVARESYDGASKKLDAIHKQRTPAQTAPASSKTYPSPQEVLTAFTPQGQSPASQ